MTPSGMVEVNDDTRCHNGDEDTLLELRDVHAGYGETPVLRGVSLTVASGGRLAVLGANGAGKTTLLRVASGLLAPSAGRILIDGVDATRLNPAGRVRLGLCHIPEPRGIFPTLTVRENLVLQSPRRRAPEGVERAVEAFPVLGRHIGQLAGTLSGGEQQMLAVARAFVQSPRIVLLDEVSMGLAPTVAEDLFGFLQQLADRGVALVIVEQFVHRALAMVDQVLVLFRGRVVLAGDAGLLDESTIFEAYTGSSGYPSGSTDGSGSFERGGEGSDSGPGGGEAGGRLAATRRLERG